MRDVYRRNVCPPSRRQALINGPISAQETVTPPHPHPPILGAALEPNFPVGSGPKGTLRKELLGVLGRPPQECLGPNPPILEAPRPEGSLRSFPGPSGIGTYGGSQFDPPSSLEHPWTCRWAYYSLGPWWEGARTDSLQGLIHPTPLMRSDDRPGLLVGGPGVPPVLLTLGHLHGCGLEAGGWHKTGCLETGEGKVRSGKGTDMGALSIGAQPG